MQLKKLASLLVVLAGVLAASLPASAADKENTMIITL
ncbi:peptidylprolyl isomerase, partial [Mesorhizobium sp. M1A.F.Ca.IN.020.06.1.1]